MTGLSPSYEGLYPVRAGLCPAASLIGSRHRCMAVPWFKRKDGSYFTVSFARNRVVAGDGTAQLLDGLRGAVASRGGASLFEVEEGASPQRLSIQLAGCTGAVAQGGTRGERSSSSSKRTIPGTSEFWVSGGSPELQKSLEAWVHSGEGQRVFRGHKQSQGSWLSGVPAVATNPFVSLSPERLAEPNAEPVPKPIAAEPEPAAAEPKPAAAAGSAEPKRVAAAPEPERIAATPAGPAEEAEPTVQRFRVRFDRHRNVRDADLQRVLEHVQGGRDNDAFGEKHGGLSSHVTFWSPYAESDVKRILFKHFTKWSFSLDSPDQRRKREGGRQRDRSAKLARRDERREAGQLPRQIERSVARAPKERQFAAMPAFEPSPE